MNTLSRVPTPPQLREVEQAVANISTAKPERNGGPVTHAPSKFRRDRVRQTFMQFPEGYTYFYYSQPRTHKERRQRAWAAWRSYRKTGARYGFWQVMGIGSMTPSRLARIEGRYARHQARLLRIAFGRKPFAAAQVDTLPPY